MQQKPAIWAPGLVSGSNLRPGLSAYWPIWAGSGDAVTDLTGTVANGEFVGTPSWIPEGLALNGAPDAVKLDNIPAMNVGLGDFTLHTVVNYNASFPSNNTIFAHGRFNDGFMLYEASGGLRFFAEGFSVTFGSTLNASDPIRAGFAWVTVTRQNDQMAAYINGLPAALRIDSISGFSRDISTTRNSWIGARDSSAGGTAERCLNGNVASVAFWDRALATGEVIALFLDRWPLLTKRVFTPFWESASSVDKHYNLYTGKGSLNDVDFDTIVAEYPEGTATGDYIGLDPGVSSTYTLVLRPEIDGLETPDISAITEFVTDGSGEWVGLRPDPVQGFSGQAIAGGIIRLTWNHRIYDGATPDDFLISYGTTPSASGSTTTVTYDGAKKYTEDITLSDGVTYWFRLQARDGSILSASRVIGGIAADATAPSAPTVTIATTWQTLPQ